MRLIEELDRRQSDGGSEVFVVVPALSGSLKQLANDDRDEIAAAQADLERLVSELGAPDRTASGLVGDSDPRLALEDSLRPVRGRRDHRRHPRGVGDGTPGGDQHRPGS
jgi:hypothetical protein